MTDFDKVTLAKRDNRLVSSESNIAIYTENGGDKDNRKVFGSTGNLHWSMYVREYVAHLYPLNQGGIGNQLVIVAFYTRNIVDYKLTQLTEYKTVAVQPLSWKSGYSNKQVVGARILLLLDYESKNSINELPAADVMFNVGGTLIPSHKTYLSFVSPVFSTMFEGKFRESFEKQITIEDADAEAFQAFLKALYPPRLPPNEENVMALLQLADRYNVETVTSMCLEFLKTATNIPLIDRILVAEKHGGGLQECILNDLMDRTLKEVLEDPKAQHLGPLTRELLKSQFSYKNLS